MFTIIILKEKQLDRIIAKLTLMEESLRHFAAVQAKTSSSPPQTNLMKGYISNRELCLQLGVNKRTLARYRAGGDLTYSLIGGKVYYSEKDVLRLMAIFRSKKKNKD